MSDARRKLLDATLDALRDMGIAGTSARQIAQRAGLGEGLVFYHFGSVDARAEAACRDATAVRVAVDSARFAELDSLHELLALGRSFHEAERAAGNVTMLAQVMAGRTERPLGHRTSPPGTELPGVDRSRPPGDSGSQGRSRDRVGHGRGPDRHWTR